MILVLFRSRRLIARVVNDYIVCCDDIVVSHVVLLGVQRLLTASELGILGALGLLRSILRPGVVSLALP